MYFERFAGFTRFKCLQNTATCFNEYRLIALTSTVMKCFERLVMRHINAMTPKCLGISTSLCSWILDFLTGRPQNVRVDGKLSSMLTVAVEMVSCFKFLGTFMTNDLAWSQHVTGVTKNVPILPQTVEKNRLFSTILTTFYRCAIENMLTCGITVYFDSSLLSDQKAFQGLIRLDQSIIGVQVCTIVDIFGAIFLPGNRVIEHANNGDEPGKFLFEVIPGADRERMTANHETYLLMASTQNDMEDWVKTIRRVIWAPFGGGIFGQKLEETVRYERRFGNKMAPMLVEQCADFIRQRGLKEEGLFRLPGQANLVKELQDAFDCGEKPSFDCNTDVHTVASLLKLYLRELPEPVIPFAKYEEFLTCTKLFNKDEESGMKELMKQVKSLPPVNYNLLKYICRFLDEVQSYSGVNKMSVQNLATVFGPNILRPKIEDPVAIMEGTVLVQQLMSVMIGKHDMLFPKDEENEMVDEVSNNNIEAQKKYTTGQLQNKENNNTKEVSVRQSPPLMVKKNPAFNSATWSTSSCEISLPDNSNSCRSSTTTCPEQDFFGGNFEDPVLDEPSRDDISQPGEFNSKFDRQSGGGQSSRATSSSDNSETFVANNTTSNHSALHSLVASLKQEMLKQKTEYETRLKSLENRNLDLEAEMVSLHEELDQERKKYTMVEIKLRNAERAKKDAEKRNETLQKEMEQFFSTFGELTVEPRRPERGNTIWIQ
ncbi:RHG24 protein, partial [Atractosteus spatula]|nr:RHG24 protein [Atractosteus spatula]